MSSDDDDRRPMSADEFFDSQPQIFTPVITLQSPVPSLGGVIAQPYYVNGNFSSPNGNQPASYNNSAFVFQGGPALNLQNAPVGSGTVTQNLQNGNVVANPTGNPYFSTDYVMAFSVGPAVTPKGGGATTYPNIAASAYIPGGVGSGLPIQYYGSNLGFVPQGVTATSIQFTYQFIAGTTPQTNGAFVGLWYGTQNNVYTTTPTNVAQIFGKESGTVIMPNLQLAVGQQYTAALYTSGYPLTVGAAAPTCIVSWFQFQIQNPT